MDPSGYGQTPPPPPPPATPPDWSQPGYGQPGYGQPGYGQPGGWPAPAPAPKRSRMPLIIAIVVVVVIVGAVLWVVASNMRPPDAGKVVFSSDKPVAGMNCNVDHKVTTIKAGTTVYAYAIYKDKQGSDVVTLTISKDGSKLGSADLPTSTTENTDCYGDTTDLGTFPAGTYTFTLTSGGKTIAEGTLTITP
jgi:hypothetical protein